MVAKLRRTVPARLCIWLSSIHLLHTRITVMASCTARAKIWWNEIPVSRRPTTLPHLNLLTCWYYAIPLRRGVEELCFESSEMTGHWLTLLVAQETWLLVLCIHSLSRIYFFIFFLCSMIYTSPEFGLFRAIISGHRTFRWQYNISRITVIPKVMIIISYYVLPLLTRT